MSTVVPSACDMTPEFLRRLAVLMDSLNGLRLHVWKNAARYQANVSDGKGSSWAVVTEDTAEEAILNAIAAKERGLGMVYVAEPPPIGTTFDPFGDDDIGFDPLG